MAIHLQDFAPPQELIPLHPVYQVQDWDDAAGAIDWPRLRASLKNVKEHGALPESHYSHDHLNEQKEIPVPPETTGRWTKRFKDVSDQWSAKGFNVVWALVDGFLLYWDSEVVDALDVKIFLCIPEKVLKQRRHERHGYHTAVQSDPEGSLWRDPPHYWEQIVYPAYVRAHEHLFENGDVEGGKLAPKYEKELVLLSGEGCDKHMGMGEMVDIAAQSILSVSDP
ncbi:P-loop nucleoside triphosphate hydrolase [Ceratobasidium sp. AG-Ba]|nr:P-loop nucleoside triphosphate hydrolase [Ceratobasidium sp. AG-Ba]QRW08232.1 P-loop nucleoside triphosphate hydrolase [Ceratobasidium sp. AG-Ba]